MLFFSRTKTFFILAAVLLGLIFASPNLMGADTRAQLPAFMQKTINLGLDLQGGAHLLLEVDVDSVIEQQLGNELTAVQQAFRENGRLRTQYLEIDEARGIIRGKMRNEEDYATGVQLVRDLSAPINTGQLGATGRTTLVTDEGEGAFTVSITDENIEAIRERTIAQSIEVLRRRIDPSGTTEMTLAREGDERILVQVPGAQNIDEIKERINTSANMSFHLVRPETNDSQIMALAAQGNLRATWEYFEGDPESSRPSAPVIVDSVTNITGECLQSANQGLHPEKNTPVVNFTFNTRCAKEFGDLTARNVGRRFAVILDEYVITAPNIQGPILGGSGFIEGGFTMQSARDLSLLLNAGALPAKLKIVEERSVGASLGDDSIQAGRFASMLGMLGVVLFMWFSYGLRFGTIANLALTTNIALIAAALSLLGSTLTLPGIAGIILTIGMAVDANVLIFERIREEAENGRPPINAIQTGYERSLAPILDANITTLIAAVTLYFVGSGPVRGFAVTLAIGIVMSVFTAVVFARLLTATWLRRSRPKSLPI